MTPRELVPPQLDGDTLVLRDARAIRALAHPVRLALLDELPDPAVERTATELADAAGVTPSAMSYHLRSLERFGIVVRADSRTDGRDRPWRRVGRHLSLDSGRVSADVAARLAFIDQLLTQLRRSWEDVFRSERQDIATLARERMWLTRDEARELTEAFSDSAERYADRRDPAARPADAMDVELTWSLLPAPRKASETGSR